MILPQRFDLAHVPVRLLTELVSQGIDVPFDIRLPAHSRVQRAWPRNHRSEDDRGWPLLRQHVQKLDQRCHAIPILLAFRTQTSAHAESERAAATVSEGIEGG